jgi:hypothetical protein
MIGSLSLPVLMLLTGVSAVLIFDTIYAPPHHQDGLIHATKNDAKKNDVEFDGKITEQIQLQ